MRYYEVLLMRHYEVLLMRYYEVLLMRYYEVLLMRHYVCSRTGCLFALSAVLLRVKRKLANQT